MKKDRNSDGIPIKKALEGYYKAMGIEDKMMETSVLSRWRELMGDAIDKRTTNKNIREKTLYLEINSAVMRDELQQRKSEIIQIINDAAGMEIVSEIFLK